ncbi:HET-domain-containing protein [Coniochaeta sp. PMI_546]|nr:HET-domain-containing protein [Coniochaeta sp. PMI_546]
MASTNRPPSLIELDSVILPLDGGEDVYSTDDQPGHETDLCPRCQQFNIQSFNLSNDFTRGYLLSDVRSAAADGCAFCSLLLDSVSTVSRPRDATELEPNPLRLPVNNNPDIYVHMTLSRDYEQVTSNSLDTGLGVNRLRTAIADRFSEVRNASDHELCLAAELGSPGAQSADVTGRYLGSDPTSAAHYDTVRDWITACCEKHPRCNQTVSGYTDILARQSPLPARCIEILTDDGEMRVRLASTEGMVGTYITLTHRWNLDTEACKTTTANQQDRQHHIDLEILPQLFRDVFTVALKLEVRYIWIDSLCIIQSGDSGADWRHEAPRMAQYYQFSLLTIAGTMSDMADGLLQPYPDESAPWGSSLVQLPYRDKTGAPAGNLFVYKRQVPVADDYWAAVRESILFRRGWILQEWLLSKRLLWYTSKGLFFECHTEGARSEYAEQVMVANARSDLRSQLQLKGSFHFDSASILDVWYSAIEVYSSCQLTKPDQDRILAVAGLAKEVGLILADKLRERVVDGVHHEVYVAGVWLRDIHRGLLWEEDHAAAPCTTRVDQAPSWSWASLMTPVRWAEKDKEGKEALKVVGLCQKRRSSHDHQPEYVVDKGRALGRSDGRRAEFDPTNMFACLHVRGTLRTSDSLRYDSKGLPLESHMRSRPARDSRWMGIYRASEGRSRR